MLWEPQHPVSHSRGHIQHPVPEQGTRRAGDHSRGRKLEVNLKVRETDGEAERKISAVVEYPL